MKIVLVGMPYSGKSTIARVLAKKTKCPMIDTDAWIEAQLGCRVSDVFAARGEFAFRQYEHQAIAALAPLSDYVVATGGGLVTTAQNRQALAELQDAVIVYLHVPLMTLNKRAQRKKGPERPLLKKQSIPELFAARKAFYEQCAQVKVNCEGKPVRVIVEEILASVTGDLPKVE